MGESPVFSLCSTLIEYSGVGFIIYRKAAFFTENYLATEKNLYGDKKWQKLGRALPPLKKTVNV